MTRFWFAVFSLLCLGATAQSRKMNLSEALMLGLPVVEIKTVDGVEPKADPIDPPEGCIGASITNATKVPGSLRLWAPDSTLLYDSGEYIEDTCGLKLNIRGNWSGRRVLKPYKLKLQKKADLLCRDDEQKYKDKNWLLLKERYMTLNTPIGFKVCELLDYCWTPAWRYVNVLFNGEYRGVYMLAENVRRNTLCRIDVSKDGFIVERNAYWWNEPVSFATQSMGTHMRYTFKYPDDDDVNDSQVTYICEALNQLEDAIAAGRYEPMLDVSSFACWLLGHDLLGTTDGAGSNQFLSKYDSTPHSPFRMETLWDFDSFMTGAGKWSATRGRMNSYYTQLFDSPDKTFAAAYVRLWESTGRSAADAIQRWLAGFAGSDEAQALDRSNAKEAALWGRTYRSVAQNVEEACAWFLARKAWMDENVATIDTMDIRTFVSSPSPNSSIFRPQPSIYYDLSGRRLSAPPAKGMYIEDGKLKCKGN